MIGIEARIDAGSAFRRGLEQALEREASRRAYAVVATRKRGRAHPWRSPQWLWPDL
jgi:hypothetical protein